MEDRRQTTDGRTPEHGYTISSPCESNGSGELIILNEPLTRDKPVCASTESRCRLALLYYKGSEGQTC